MTRTTRRDLDALASMIDRALDLPDGTHDVGYAYGSPRLSRDGGSVDVSPRLPAGELRRWMRAYLDGIYAARTPEPVRCDLCHASAVPVALQAPCDCEPVAVYTAGWNMAGYLPETEPETFGTLEDAAAYLVETLARWLDDDEAPEDMRADDIIAVDTTADYADGWYTPASGGAAIHLWAERLAR